VSIDPQTGYSETNSSDDPSKRDSLRLSDWFILAGMAVVTGLWVILFLWPVGCWIWEQAKGFMVSGF